MRGPRRDGAGEGPRGGPRDAGAPGEGGRSRHGAKPSGFKSHGFKSQGFKSQEGKQGGKFRSGKPGGGRPDWKKRASGEDERGPGPGARGGRESRPSQRDGERGRGWQDHRGGGRPGGKTHGAWSGARNGERGVERRERADGEKRPYGTGTGRPGKGFGGGAPRGGEGRGSGPRHDKPFRERGGEYRGGRDGAPRGDRRERPFDKRRSHGAEGDRPFSDSDGRPRGERERRFDRDGARDRFRSRDGEGGYRGPRNGPRRDGERDGFRGGQQRRDRERDGRSGAPRSGRDDRGRSHEGKPFRPSQSRRRKPAQEQPGGSPAEPMRIARAMARAGLCSRREAERWIEEGRVTVNGRTLDTPAVEVGPRDMVLVDGLPLPEPEPVRLWRYHKPRGLVTTHSDPEGRPTVFETLPAGMPRVISIGRLDFNTEGLLLLTTDGALARHLELPSTGWLRRYRVRARGRVTQAQLDELKAGVTIDGVHYGAIDATLDSEHGANIWLTVGLREGKNREIRKIMGHLGLEVGRLIRVSFGPFQLLEIEPGRAEPVRRRTLIDQLGPRLARELGVVDDSEDQGRAGGSETAVGTSGKGRSSNADADDVPEPESPDGAAD
ncbi:MAG: pseudouridine synthase [Hyphomicrobiaceae bacterium]